VLLKEHEGGHEEQERVTDEPDRAVLRVAEKAEPRRTAQDAVEAARGHRNLETQRRDAGEEEEGGEPPRADGEAPLPRPGRRLVRRSGEQAHHEHAHDEETRARGQRADRHAGHTHRAAVPTVKV